jgi:hypothetical protein
MSLQVSLQIEKKVGLKITNDNLGYSNKNTTRKPELTNYRVIRVTIIKPIRVFRSAGQLTQLTPELAYHELIRPEFSGEVGHLKPELREN